MIDKLSQAFRLRDSPPQMLFLHCHQVHARTQLHSNALMQLGLSWAIAGSRIVDNKHNPSDVVAGFFLGVSVAVVFLLRSIPCLK